MGISVSKELFDLDKICRSGQIFRWRINDYTRLNANFCLRLFIIDAFIDGKDRSIGIIDDSSMDTYSFLCEEDEFNNIWENYFDLSPESNQIYRDFYKLMAFYHDSDYLKDVEFLYRCANYGEGIRILNQDPWETMVSFIISQNNSIPKIRRSIQYICDENNRLFPTAEKLRNLDLSKCSLGYRDKYLYSLADEMCQNKEFFKMLEYYKRNELNLFIHELKKLNGVGDKVANCIALFGFHFLNAFPTDTWINKIIQHKFKKGTFTLTNNVDSEYSVLDRNWAGLTQQYMYFYAINNKHEFQ